MSAFDRPSTVRVWPHIASAAKCRWCRLPIVFRTTDRGQQMPFNAGIAPVDAVEDFDGRKFELLAWADKHKCTKRPGSAPKPATAERRPRRYRPSAKATPRSTSRGGLF